MPLFRCCALKKKKKDKEGNIVEPEEILVDVVSVIANDSQGAMVNFVMKHGEKLKGIESERLNIGIRPFG